MTCKELYDIALSMLPSNPSEDDSLQQYVPGWVNLAMRETFHYENGLRMMHTDPLRPVLETAPTVATINDDIPYSPELSEYAFVYYLASLMSKDDDDNYWAQDYRSRYLVAVNESSRMIQTSVLDVYAEVDHAGEHSTE